MNIKKISRKNCDALRFETILKQKKEETNPSVFFQKPNRAEMTVTVPIDP